MAEHQIVNDEDLEIDRLDADFYRPHYVANQRIMRSTRVGRLRVLSNAATRMACGPFGSNLPSSLYRNVGIPLYRVQNVRDGIVSNEGLVFLDEETSKDLGSCAFSAGDLLLAKAGLLGRAASVPLSIGRCNVTQDVIGIAVDKSKADPHYLLAFLTSKIGRMQIIRWGQGNVQQHLNMPSVRRFEWIEIDRDAQRYIGDKVRQAEGLRVLEVMLEQEIVPLFRLAEWQGHRAGAQKTYRLAFTDMTTERLDASHYDPAHLHLGKILRNQDARSLSTVCAAVDERWHRREREFFYLEIGEIDLTAGRVNARKLPTSEAPSRAQRLVKPRDVVVATVRPNRKNVAIVGEVSENLPIVASTGFSVLRFQSDEAAAFYHAWLRSDAATQQLVQWSAGGAYPAIEEDIPLRILVPPFSDDVVSGTGRKCKTKLIAGEFAGKLCDSAKLLVEALIEGRIVEDELREAQQALDRGDTCPDRAILSRLTEHDIDGPGKPPLFPDLDALYTAIEGSQCVTHRNGEAT